jgi:predicted metal-binding membrane protein
MTSVGKTTANMRRFPGRVRKLATSSGTPNPGSVASLSRRDRILISGYVAAVTLLSWSYLFYLDHQMLSARQHDKMMMEMGMSMAMPWTTVDVFFTFAMWVVMMVGMMTGSALPVMLLFAGAHARRGAGRAPFIVLIFGLGYLTVWVGFSACATLAQWALHHAAVLSPEMAASSPRIGGAILCVAGVYQLTPFKRACLMHCQSPLGFLMTRWRDGTSGALQMGVRHGAYCLGCCWALMCVLFVAGVMNLVWVATLALFVFFEKIGPAGAVVARVAGAAMIVVGVLRFAGIL